jgi:MoaA/NifB/PqqE/SkfB family radical SAM enzyme
MERINTFKLVQTPDYPDFDLKITLKPSFRCNQNCWFCEEYDNAASDWSEADCELVLSSLDDILGEYRDKKVFIYFYGGEPTLSKNWENIQYAIVKNHPGNELFIQTQTNMSINRKRLGGFLKKINSIKSAKHTIDICSSYHLQKQRVEIFKEKMAICEQYDALGLCFFNTDYLNEEQFLNEFYYLCEHYPEKMKLRFTEIGDGVDTKLEAKKYPKTDNLEAFEFNYFMKKYPQLNKYFEQGFNFDVDGKIMNFSEVNANNIHKKFKLMRCECGSKNLVIDHNLMTYQCNDDFYNNHSSVHLSVLDFGSMISKEKYCMNNECYDGLEFVKWR